ncbi:MAG: hypothetical protein GWO10_21280, partial [candidate division Zixibacteria bacterium]|nr:hypothetical protein [Gammaproteobacteria bacterium]NIR25988.1 hypothetical protein [Gammaproteobacteria bacterium]NIR66233.1 hypothetical protein [candidate division Zixibacteria bacterium]NIW47351.1 hypothetical protein [Gammaproteobacteria bacterium]NIX01597.1 hypothetical protein [Phycisphaerae bacterium]
DDDGLVDTDTETISVYARTLTSTEPVTVERVEFLAGAATYTVSADSAPKAIIFVYSQVATDSNVDENSTLGIGFCVYP